MAGEYHVNINMENVYNVDGELGKFRTQSHNYSENNLILWYVFQKLHILNLLRRKNLLVPMLQW